MKSDGPCAWMAAYKRFGADWKDRDQFSPSAKGKDPSGGQAKATPTVAKATPMDMEVDNPSQHEDSVSITEAAVPSPPRHQSKSGKSVKLMMPNIVGRALTFHKRQERVRWCLFNGCCLRLLALSFL